MPRVDGVAEPLAEETLCCNGEAAERNAEMSNELGDCMVCRLPSVEPPNCSAPVKLIFTPDFSLGFGRAHLGRWSSVIKSGGLNSSQLAGSRVCYIVVITREKSKYKIHTISFAQ